MAGKSAVETEDNLFLLQFGKSVAVGVILGILKALPMMAALLYSTSKDPEHAPPANAAFDLSAELHDAAFMAVSFPPPRKLGLALRSVFVCSGAWPFNSATAYAPHADLRVQPVLLHKLASRLRHLRGVQFLATVYLNLSLCW